MNRHEETSDEELLDRLARGDSDALAAVSERYFDTLYDLAIRTSLDPALAAAAVGATLARAGSEYGAARLPLPAWLLGVARDETLERLRTRAPADGDDGAPLPSHDPRFCALPPDHGSAADADLSAWAWQSARSQRPRDYSLLDLAVRRGLSADEIAEAAAMSQSGIYAVLGRLRGTFEESFAATVLYYRGSDACSELASLVRAHPQIGPAVRRDIGRHAETCPDCRATRRRQPSPADLMAAFLPVPPDTEARAAAMAAAADAAAAEEPPPVAPALAEEPEAAAPDMAEEGAPESAASVSEAETVSGVESEAVEEVPAFEATPPEPEGVAATSGGEVVQPEAAPAGAELEPEPEAVGLGQRVPEPEWPLQTAAAEAEDEETTGGEPADLEGEGQATAEEAAPPTGAELPRDEEVEDEAQAAPPSAPVTERPATEGQAARAAAARAAAARQRRRGEGAAGHGGPPPPRGGSRTAFSDWFAERGPARLSLLVLLAGATLLAAYLGLALGASLEGGNGNGSQTGGIGVLPTAQPGVRQIACGTAFIDVEQGSRNTVTFDSPLLQGFEISDVGVRPVSAVPPQSLSVTPRPNLTLALEAFPLAGAPGRVDEYKLIVTFTRGSEKTLAECTVRVRAPLVTASPTAAASPTPGVTATPTPRPPTAVPPAPTATLPPPTATPVPPTATPPTVTATPATGTPTTATATPTPATSTPTPGLTATPTASPPASPTSSP